VFLLAHFSVLWTIDRKYGDIDRKYWTIRDLKVTLSTSSV